MSNHKRWLKKIGILVILILPSMVMALPPKVVQSAGAVNIHATPIGSRTYEFTAGQYGYKFLWDRGPVEIILHAVNGYDNEGNLVTSLPASIIFYDYYWERIVNITSEPEAILTFYGLGKARYASTLPAFQVPESLYNEKMVHHVSVDFSVVDGRMSVGPWISMLTDWADEASVRRHVELLLW